MTDSRRYPRAPLTGQVRCYQWDAAFQAPATALSATGLFLRTQAALSEGKLLTLRMSIPGLNRAFTVLGKVVRTVRGGLLMPAGVGIQFVDIATSDRRSILDYVSTRTLRTV